jgi:YaiO family outer membrane protein
MKKNRLIHALATLTMTSLAMTAHALPSGTATVGVSAADMDSGYQDGKSQAYGLLLNVSPGTQVGLNLTNVKAFGDHATVFGARINKELNKTYSVNASVAGSDRAQVTVGRQMNVGVRMKTLEKKNLILGAGVGYFDMRGGGYSTSLRADAVYYVPKTPVIIQADATFSQSSVGSRQGNRFGIGATYAPYKKWSVFGKVDTGRVHYALLSQPQAVADYNSKSLVVGGSYWLSPAYGVTAAAGKVANEYFNRNELRLGMFFNF